MHVIDPRVGDGTKEAKISQSITKQGKKIYHQRKIYCFNGYNYRIISKMHPLKREVPQRQAQSKDTVDKQKVRLLIIFLHDKS